MSDNDVYYKLYLNHDNKLCVVCMQWFDEYDYDQDRFLSDKKFEDEDEAEKVLELCEDIIKLMDGVPQFNVLNATIKSV